MYGEIHTEDQADCVLQHGAGGSQLMPFPNKDASAALIQYSPRNCNAPADLHRSS